MLIPQEIGSPRADPGLGGNSTPGGVERAGASSPQALSDAEKWKRHADRKKVWREKNKEHHNEYMREYQRAWKARNRDRLKEYRKAWKTGEKAGTLVGLMASQGGRCKLCGEDLKEARHLDHKIPRSKGGQSALDNYQYLCPPCNIAKGTFTNDEFFEHIRRILLFNGKWYE